MNYNPSEMFPVALTARRILDQIEAMRSIVARMSADQDTKPSRRAVRKLAEDLILEYRASEAEQTMNLNPIGAVSFLFLVRKWSNQLSDEGHELVLNKPQDYRPFGELSSWVITRLDSLEAKWAPELVAQDDFGFSGWPSKSGG